jgi:hypothetical protein
MFGKRILTVITLVILLLFSGCNSISRPVGDTDLINSNADVTIQPSKGFTRGTWDNDVYTNDLVGFKFILPQGWKISSDEALAEFQGISADVMSDPQKWMKESSKMATFTDVITKNPEKRNTILIMFENLLLTGGSLDISEEEYIDAVKKRMSKNTKFDFEFDKPIKVKIASDEYLTMHCLENNTGSSLYIFIRKSDKYMAFISVTLNDKTTIDDILAQFKQK